MRKVCLDNDKLTPLQRDFLSAFFARETRFFLTGGAALKPGLNTDMNQAEVTVHEIEVQMQTLPPGRFDKRTLIGKRFLKQKRKAPAWLQY